MHLRETALVHLAPGLLGVPIVRPAIRVEGTEEPLRFNDLPQSLEAAHRPFLLDEEGGVELGGRIIQGRNEIPLTAGHPFMPGAVLMEHHPWQGLAGSLLAMRAAPRCADDLALSLQPLLRPGVGACSAMVLLPALVEMFDGPSRIPGLIQRHHLQDFVDWDRSG